MTAPLPRRAALLGGGASAAGITSGFSALAPNPDADLLALRPRLVAAVAEVNASEMADDHHVPPGAADKDHDAWVSRTGGELTGACWAIVDAPPAQTAAGRALKAAAAMHQLRMAYCLGGWPGDGEELAWNVLSEVAGAAYVPPSIPEHLRAGSEPERV